MPKVTKNAETATATAETPKATRTKAPKAKPEGKAPKGKATPKAETPKGDSVRVRMFKALAKAGPTGLTMPQLTKALGLNRPLPMAKHEALAGKGARIAYRHEEGTRGAFYVLTPAGTKALKAGTVDSDKPDSSVGKSELVSHEE